MKILLVTDNHTETGGAENYFFALKEKLKCNNELNVYSLGFGPRELEGNDFYILRSVRSNVPKLIWRVLVHPIVYFKLRKYIRKIHPDVIHLHNVKQYTATVLRALKSYPIVQTIHDYGPVCPIAHNIHYDKKPCTTGVTNKCFWQHRVKYNPIIYLTLALSFFLLNKQLKKRVKKFFAPSPQLVDYLQRNHFSDATYIQPFIQERKVYSFDKMQAANFLFAGNLGAHKGIDILLDEFALACGQNPNLNLTIAGTGLEEARLQKQIQQLGLTDRIKMIGWQKNLDAQYEKCTAVIFPSIWMEAFGLVITEAMSFGRAVIGSDRGSPPWLIDDKHTGLIFNPLQRGDLAKKILTLANDIELAKNLGKNAFAKLQTLSTNEKMIEKIVGIYRDVVSEHVVK